MTCVECPHRDRDSTRWAMTAFLGPDPVPLDKVHACHMDPAGPCRGHRTMQRMVADGEAKHCGETLIVDACTMPKLFPLENPCA